MKLFVDIHGRQIRLTPERQEHIETDHPEMSGQMDKIQNTLKNPDLVVRSRTDQEVELFTLIMTKLQSLRSIYVL